MALHFVRFCHPHATAGIRSLVGQASTIPTRLARALERHAQALRDAARTGLTRLAVGLGRRDRPRAFVFFVRCEHLNGATFCCCATHNAPHASIADVVHPPAQTVCYTSDSFACVAPSTSGPISITVRAQLDLDHRRFSSSYRTGSSRAIGLSVIPQDDPG
jgi:hypothetical protein